MRSRATDAFGNALGNSLAVGGTSHDDASLRLIRQGQPDLLPLVRRSTCGADIFFRAQPETDTMKIPRTLRLAETVCYAA